MKTLKEYQRESEKMDLKVRSVSITAVQDKFIRSNKLNLSAIARDAIELIMKGKSK